ncbi:hypothetical protein C9890_0356 [Perkinsus sp. BL_2016]|nr:hypothetical protein C9890_0356 [Perkinsus sp. BL_2016]
MSSNRKRRESPPPRDRRRSRSPRPLPLPSRRSGRDEERKMTDEALRPERRSRRPSRDDDRRSRRDDERSSRTDELDKRPRKDDEEGRPRRDDDRRYRRDDERSSRRDELDKRPRRDEDDGRPNRDDVRRSRRDDERSSRRDDDEGRPRRDDDKRPRGEDERSSRRDDDDGRPKRDDDRRPRREEERSSRREDRPRRDEGNKRAERSRRDEDERRFEEERRPRWDEDSATRKETNGSRTVWIGSIPDSVGDEAIYDELMRAGDGEILGLRLVPQRGFGYVRFVELEAAERALNARIEIGGRRLRIDHCDDIPTLTHPYKPADGSKPPACSTLFVGNLPADATEDLLMSFFKKILDPLGVEVQSISLRRGGGLKGMMSFAHVRFASGDDCMQAALAVAGMRLSHDGTGHRIRVDWAVEKAGMSAAASVNAELRGKTNKIFIAGLNDGIDEGEIRSVFQTFGEVTSLRLNRDKAGVRSFGYLTYSSPDSAAAAIDKIATVLVGGVKVRGDFARPDRAAPVTAQAPPEAPRGRSPSPDYPRMTPVSYEVPLEYGPMPTWIECYGNSMVRGSVEL